MKYTAIISIVAIILISCFIFQSRETCNLFGNEAPGGGQNANISKNDQKAIESDNSQKVDTSDNGQNANNSISEKISNKNIENTDNNKMQRLERASLIRFGIGGAGTITMMDKDLNFYYDNDFGFFIDYFYLRFRNSEGNGIDFYIRFTYRHFWTSDDIKLWQDDYVYEDNLLHIYSLDAGVRAIYGAYFLGQLWQTYIFIAPRYLNFLAQGKNSRYGASDPDSNTRLGCIGFIGGIGLEVTIFSFLGIFFEFNVGYCAVGNPRRNVEGLQGYLGLTYRHSYFW